MWGIVCSVEGGTDSSLVGSREIASRITSSFIGIFSAEAPWLEGAFVEVLGVADEFSPTGDLVDVLSVSPRGEDGDRSFEED
jgi:hypothetical protein